MGLLEGWGVFSGHLVSWRFGMLSPAGVLVPKVIQNKMFLQQYLSIEALSFDSSTHGFQGATISSEALTFNRSVRLDPSTKSQWECATMHMLLDEE